MVRIAATAVVALMAVPVAQAQTVTVYRAPTGVVGSTLYTVMTLVAGGSADLSPVVGPNCYLGQVCGFPAGYVGTFLSYTLPDGSSATLADYHGLFEPWGAGYRIVGVASGTDSLGRAVKVQEHVTLTISCRGGRGGGCTKTYTDGRLKVSVG